MAGLMKLLDPIIAPVAKLYKAQLAKDLNKMGELDNDRTVDELRIVLGLCRSRWRRSVMC
jgi:hypothetical protein